MDSVESDIAYNLDYSGIKSISFIFCPAASYLFKHRAQMKCKLWESKSLTSKRPNVAKCVSNKVEPYMYVVTLQRGENSGINHSGDLLGFTTLNFRGA